jgi:hypothetical protein
MDTITNVEVLVNLAALRTAVAETVKRQYGAEREYAVALNAEFTFNWFDVEASDKSETAKPVHAEKGELYKVLHAAKHSNPSTVWARIRKYAAEEAKLVGTHGFPMPAYDAEGNLITDVEAGESGGANNARSPMLRNIEDLVALFKFNGRQEALDPKIIKAQVHIGAALQALGLDLANLPSKK